MPKRGRPKPPYAPSSPSQKPRQCQSALAQENQISAATETAIRDAFNLFAVTSPSSSGSEEPSLPATSLRRALVALNAPSPQHEIPSLLEAADPLSTGSITYENFVAVAALKLAARSDDDGQEREVEEAFRLFTLGRGDGITLRMLKRVAAELKENVAEEALINMMKEAGGEGGVVGIREFESVMRRAGVFR